MEKQRIGRTASQGVVTAGLSFVLVLLLAKALGRNISAAKTLLSACGTALFAAGLTFGKKTRLATLLIGIAAAVLFVLRTGVKPIEDAFSVLTGDAEGDVTPLAVMASSAVTLLLFGSCRLTERAYPAMIVTASALMGAQVLSGSADAVCTTAALFCCVCLFAMESGRVRLHHVLPAAVIVCLLSLALVPPAGTVWDRAHSFAEKVRKLFEDYTAFDDARQTYSLYTDGFQPLGDALGGPAEPRDTEIMTVETDQPLLLRGSIRRTYTGTAWTEPAVNSRFLYLDPTGFSVRSDVFDSDMLSGLGDVAPLERVDAKVTMLSDGISTLFVPHRLLSLSVAYDTPAYFSSSGEVFITRGVLEGDTYSFSALNQPKGSKDLGTLLERAAQKEDKDYPSIVQSYTGLPQGIDKKVYAIAEKIIAPCETPYEKACAIEDWLFENCKYTLDMDYTPKGKDFVSYFLLKQRKGYCTYFASAFAVLCRMANLPTRYIEGYACTPSADGARVVTGHNAHAWVEVYFEGAGWVAFNPTPGDEEENGEGDDASGATDGADDDGEETPDEDDIPEDEPPTEEETEEPEEPEFDDPEPEEPEETPEDEPEEEDAPPARSRLPLLWLLLLLPAAYVVLRYRASDPARMEKRCKDGRERLLVWYEDALCVLAILGMPRQNGESPVQYAQRIEDRVRLLDTAQEVENAVFGEKEPSAAALKRTKTGCERLRRRMNIRQKAIYTAKRIAKGRVFAWTSRNCKASWTD